MSFGKSDVAMQRVENSLDSPETVIGRGNEVDYFKADAYWDNYFSAIERQEPMPSHIESRQLPENAILVDGKAEYYDDSGNLYRVEQDLLPDNHYSLNGYEYKTDNLGRIISASGNLHMKDREGRLPIRDSIEDIGKGDQRPGDDRGHLIGDQFDGVNGLENMIPQDADINRNDFKRFENQLAKAVKEGNEVKMSVEPVYDDTSRRPTAIVVSYSINGEEELRIFPNGKE